MNFSGLKDRSIRLKNTVVKHKELSIVVSLLFAARLFLSNLQSYWLDEHYSVWAYGSYFSNPFEMGFFFAKESVHPPLYQMTLWFYMKIFGDSEIATRTLSNIFIAIAMIALYALIRDAVPKWLAVLAAAVYGAEPSGILYAIETRSYAMTLALSIVSLLALKRFVLGSAAGYRKNFWLFTFAIAGLMFTHYYNMFLVGALGAYLLTQLAMFKSDKKLGKRYLQGVWAILTGVAMYAVIWGAIFVVQFFFKKGKYAGTDKLNIFDMYNSMLVDLNLDASSVIITVLVYVSGAIAFTVLFLQIRKRSFKYQSLENVLLQLTFATFLPILASYVAFVAINAARESSRYYIYSAALLPVFMLLAFYWAIEKFAKAKNANRKKTWQAVVASAFVLAAVLPQSVAAANEGKINWRGTIQFATEWSEENYPGGVNFVEVSFRPKPMSAYYIGKNNYQPLTLHTIQKLHDETAVVTDYTPEKLGITKAKPLLILYLVHYEGRLTTLATALSTYYDVVERYIDHDGHGFVVYVPKG